MESISEAYQKCRLCPRKCGADRSTDAEHLGVCGESSRIRLARAALHLWEEPCISGECGSGAVFFSGCPLRCVYCQNAQIARGKIGMEISMERLVEIYFELAEEGAENINLVTPTHYTPSIIESVKRAKEQGLRLPILYNCSGYEKPETLEQLTGIVDIYLTDFKYMKEELASRYSKALDYPQRAKEALREMLRQQPKAVFDSRGMMQKGVIVRHLLLPGNVKNAKEVVDYCYQTYGEQIWFSLMNQYTPLSHVAAYPEINRKVTRREYDRLIDHVLSLGITQAFVQEGEAAKESFIPAFDYEGVKRK